MSLHVSVVGTRPKVATMKRREFTLQEQHEIISYQEEVFVAGHKILNKALGEWANVKFNNLAFALTIGRLLKWKASIIATDVDTSGASKRRRKAQCPELEVATFDWFTRMEEKGVAL